MEIKNRLAIVTVVSGEKYERLWTKTGPTFEAYAARIGAELVVMGHHDGLPSQHWVKLGIHELLRKRFHRVAYIDADAIIRDDCPSLFDVVPDNKLGIFNEGKYTPRSICIYEIMHAYGITLPKWNRIDYYNTGVMVVSRDQRFLFNPPNEIKRIRNSYGEQTWLNMQILKANLPIFELSHKFNRMSLMDRMTGVSRKDAFIIHYAGPPSEQALHEALDDDLAAWSMKSYGHVPKLFIDIGGGLGDQVCAEPVIRYIRDTLYPEAEITAVTAYPRIFQHLNGIVASDKMPAGRPDAVHPMETHPGEHTPHGKYVVYTHSHQVDYISLVTIKRTLPVMEKDIVLTWNQEDLEEVDSISREAKSLVLVHAGRGWPSKTFPVDWWQNVVDSLSLEGYRVGLIGGTVNDDHAYQPIELPQGGVDFRDKLSLGGLIYLLSQSPALITNDSGPLHVAGSSKNWIFLIPTCKHPDYILPYRQGSIHYRTSVLYRRLVCEDRPYRPTDVEAWNPKDLGADILDFIPSPGDVVNAVNENPWVNFMVGLNPDHPIAAKGAIHE